MSSEAVFGDRGRVAVATAVKLRPIHVAWGRGLPAWDDLYGTAGEVKPSVNATQLVDEIGRRQITRASYVTPDPNGDIVVRSGRYTITETPTNRLYVETTFDYADSPGVAIREVGVFVGCATNPALPPGQLYFLPPDIVDPGELTVLAHVARVVHTETTRQTFRYVIPF